MGTDVVIVGDVMDDEVFTKSSFSWAYWVRRNNDANVELFIDKVGASLHSPAETQRQFAHSLREPANDNRLAFAWYGGLGTNSYRVHRTTTPLLASDGWVHIVVSYNKYHPVIGSRIKIYRDGVEDVELWLSSGNPEQIQDGTSRISVWWQRWK